MTVYLSNLAVWQSRRLFELLRSPIAVAVLLSVLAQGQPQTIHVGRPRFRSKCYRRRRSQCAPSRSFTGRHVQTVRSNRQRLSYGCGARIWFPGLTQPHYSGSPRHRRGYRMRILFHRRRSNTETISFNRTGLLRIVRFNFYRERSDRPPDSLGATTRATGHGTPKPSSPCFRY